MVISMDTHTAVTALRALDSLPEARRRYLSAIAATAPTDADRARIVVLAKRENIDQRWATEQALKAELDNRREWASRNEMKPVEVSQEASQRIVRTDDTTPEPRPVSVRFVAPTKTAKAKPVRPESIGVNRVYNDAPKPLDPARTHGIVSTYNWGCRCNSCSEASARYGRDYRARKRTEKRSGKSAR